MKAPVRDVDIRRAASIAVAGTVLRSTMMIKPRWEQTRLLDFRVKTSSVGPRCDHGAEPVVSLCPVTPTRANPCMISIGVTHSVAIGASSIPRMNLQAEAQGGHDPVQDTVHMQAQSSTRKGLEPRTCSGFLKELEMRRESFMARNKPKQAQQL